MFMVLCVQNKVSPEGPEPKKGTVYFRIFHKNIRGLGKIAGELLTHLHPELCA